MKLKIFSDFSKPKLTFSGKHKQPIFGELENSVNNWLADNPAIKIHKIEQTISGGFFLGEAEKLTITIFYEN